MRIKTDIKARGARGATKGSTPAVNLCPAHARGNAAAAAVVAMQQREQYIYIVWVYGT